jgi:DNA polymerase I
MKNVVFDLETDGLLDEMTQIHCLVLRDLDTNEVVSCTDSAPGYTPIAEGLRILSGASRIYGHNIIKFDIPAIRQVHPEWQFSGRAMDTLTMARMRFAHIEPTDYEMARQGKLPGSLCGSHSLEAWGYRLGVMKGTYAKQTDWKLWTPEMQEYCVLDTEVTMKLVGLLRDSGLAPESIETEHELADYLARQERNGWPFDMEKAQALYAKLAARREQVAQELRDEFGWWFAANGEALPKRDNKKLGAVAGAPYTKLKVVEFNPGSRDHIARVLSGYGWVPRVFTPTGKPQVDESTLGDLDFPAAKKVLEYLMLEKRIGQIGDGDRSWFNYATMDGPEGGKLTGMYHVHGSVNQNRAVTHRAGHSHPNVAQVPASGAEYGHQCREIWTVPDGWVLIGSDASGLELRCLAHYMARYDDGAYRDILLNGDIHSANRDALGLEGKEGRAKAKTFIYAFLYGSGDYNLGTLVSPPEDFAEECRDKQPTKWRKTEEWHRKRGYPTAPKDIAATIWGGMLRDRFLKNLPALKMLIDAVKAAAKAKQYLLGLDNRRVYIRHQHAALNSLLQSAGAIICKRWIVEFNRRLLAEFGQQGWHGQWAALGWIHDEVQIAVRPEVAPRVCEILVESIEAMTDHFKFRCPLTGEAQVGQSWAETH